jgi:hypothetical protein
MRRLYRAARHSLLCSSSEEAGNGGGIWGRKGTKQPNVAQALTTLSRPKCSGSKSVCVVGHLGAVAVLHRLVFFLGNLVSSIYSNGELLNLVSVNEPEQQTPSLFFVLSVHGQSSDSELRWMEMPCGSYGKTTCGDEGTTRFHIKRYSQVTREYPHSWCGSSLKSSRWAAAPGACGSSPNGAHACSARHTSVFLALHESVNARAEFSVLDPIGAETSCRVTPCSRA